MNRVGSLLLLVLVLTGCASPTPTLDAPATIEITATQSASATPTTIPPTDEALPTITAQPVLERYEAITPPPLNAAAFSPDGSRLAYVSTIGLTMLDATNDYEKLWEAPLIGVESFGLAWSADGARLVTIRAMERNNNQTGFVSVTKASVLTMDASNGVVLNEAPSDALRVRFDVNGKRVSGGSVYSLNPAALSRDGARYAVPSASEVVLGESATGTEQILNFELTTENSGVLIMGMAFSGDGRLFAAGGEEYRQQMPQGGTVQVWSLDTMTVIDRFDVNQPGSVAFSPDASQIAVLSGQAIGGRASGLHVFNLTTGETVWSQFGEFNTVAWSEYGIYTELEGRLVRYHAETGNRYEREGLVFPAYLSSTWLEASEYGVIRVTPEFVHLLDSEEMASRVLANGFLPSREAGLGASSYGEVATYSPDGSAVALRSHSSVWVRFSDSTYYKGIEGTGALAWSPQSDRIAIGDGQDVAIWGARGPMLQHIESPIPVQWLMWMPDDVLVVAGNIGLYPERVAGWEVAETAFAAIDLATGEIVWERAGFSEVRHVTASAQSGRIVIEQQRGEQGYWFLMLIDAMTGETLSEMRMENAVNFPAVLSPDGSRLIMRDYALYNLFDAEFGLIEQSGGAAPGAIQWAADSGSVLAMSGGGYYSVWDRELGVICQKNARIGMDGLARAIQPTWGEVIFETQQRVLEVWRMHDVQGCG